LLRMVPSTMRNKSRCMFILLGSALFIENKKY
jgi:hypothetical protein